MSITLLAFLAQSLSPPEGSPPGIALTIEGPSAASLTDPIVVYQCDVEAIDGQNYQFSIKDIGKRGFESSDGKADYIDAKVEILQDESGLFAQYVDWISINSKIEGLSPSKNAAFGQRVRLDFQRTDFQRKGQSPNIRAVLIQAYFGYLTLTKAVGFCSADFKEQLPLSEDEISRLKNQ
ncbi:MAG: hypothetical protein AAGE37_07905 [Pseudomonadota bacterium]